MLPGQAAGTSYSKEHLETIGEPCARVSKKEE
jgi:hypothetical protein